MGAKIKSPGTRVTCDQCNLLSINGIACHEHGCPNAKKTWIVGEWVRLVRCQECGYSIPEGESCCNI